MGPAQPNRASQRQSPRLRASEQAWVVVELRYNSGTVRDANVAVAIIPFFKLA